MPLGGCRDVAVGCQVREEALHFPGPRFAGVGVAAEVEDAPANPLAIGLLGSIGVVVVAEDLSYLVHKAEAGIRSEFRLGFHFRPFNIAISGKNQGKSNKRTGGALVFPCFAV